MSKSKPIEEMSREEAFAEWDRLRLSLPSKPPQADECEGGPAEVLDWHAAEFRLFLLAIRAGNFDPDVVQGRADRPSHPTRRSETDVALIARVAAARRAELLGRAAHAAPKPVSELSYSEAEREYFALSEALPFMGGHPKNFSMVDGDPESLLDDYESARSRMFFLSIRVGAEDERLDELERVIAARRAFCAPYEASEARTVPGAAHIDPLDVEPRPENAYITMARRAHALVKTFESPNPEHVNAIAALTAAFMTSGAATAAAEIVATSIGHAASLRNEQMQRADIAEVAMHISARSRGHATMAYSDLVSKVHRLLRHDKSDPERTALRAELADLNYAVPGTVYTQAEYEALPEAERAKVTEHVRELHRMVTGRLRDA